MNAATNTTTYRVYHCSEAAKEATRKAREESGIKVQDFIALAIADHLGPITDTLKALGLAKSQGRKAIRLPMDDGQLEHLRHACEQTGIPASDLLLICLAQASKKHFTEEAPKASKKASKPDLTKKAGAPAKPQAKKTTKAPRKRAAKK